MLYPTIHLNGTSKETLQEQYGDAHTAIRKALDVLAKSAPHARDYYPQGDTAIRTATAEHNWRMKRLDSVMTELWALWENIERDYSTDSLAK